jgi:hypothetical protein
MSFSSETAKSRLILKMDRLNASFTSPHPATLISWQKMVKIQNLVHALAAGVRDNFRSRTGNYGKADRLMAEAKDPEGLGRN